MPVTAAELTQYGKSSIDLYVKDKPIDAINAERPYLKCLMDTKKETTAGKQYLVVPIRKGNDSNFQDFYGSDTVTYNRKDTLNSANFEYTNFHDGFSLHEDDFIRNGVVVTEGGPGKQSTSAEKETIVNLFNEQNETLRTGFEESLDLSAHAGFGTNLSAVVANVTSNALYGLSDMISLTPTTGTYAGINRATATYFRNHAAIDLTTGSTGNILTRLRAAWRACTKYGGRPNKILVGAGFLDAYVDHMLTQFGVVNYQPVAMKGIDGAEGGVFYQGVPMEWDPTFDLLDDNSIETGTRTWSKRCYIINTKFMKMMPIKGQHMVTRTPPRVYNRYEYYWALTTRFYLVNTKPRAMAVLSLA